MDSIKNFKNICKVCDHILRKKLNEITIANNSLNLIKGHPVYLELYNEKKLKRFLNLLLNLCKNFVHLIFSIIKKKKNR